MLCCVPSPNTNSGQPCSEEQQGCGFRNTGGGRGDVHHPGEASAASLAAEYVSHEDVPRGIRGGQLSNSRVGEGKMQIIDARSGSAIAAR